MAINYGYNKVRFITPVKVGAKIRARAEITKVDQLDGGAQATVTTTVEIDGSEKPAAVAESIVRYLGLSVSSTVSTGLSPGRPRSPGP